MFVLDCCSLTCPEPVIRCKQALAANKISKIQILVDNKPASENVSRLLENCDFQVVISQDQENLWAIHGLRDESKSELVKYDNVQNVNETSVSNLPFFHGNQQKSLVLITTDTLGQGDDELGKKLMESFLSTLAEISPWQIILLNGGVKLSAYEGSCLESLKKLEQENVRILVCGACLNHFNLYEEKKVGETTNMLDVVTALGLADKVIRP